MKVLAHGSESEDNVVKTEKKKKIDKPYLGGFP